MPRRQGSRVKTNIMLDEENYAHVQAYLQDPTTGRLIYGGLQSIINELLHKFFNKMHEPGVDPVELLAHYGVDIKDVYATKKEKGSL